jgi:hypothetical protein
MSGKSGRGGERNAALRLLRLLQDGEAKCRIIGKQKLACENRSGSISISSMRLADLANANLILRVEDRIMLTEEGRAHLARRSAASEPFLMQHGGVVSRERVRNDPIDAALVDEAESPLAWLARRRGPGGKPLIDAAQFQAGERLRADFTCAGLTPRVTSNWVAPIAQGRRANGASLAVFSDAVLAAKERFGMALEAVGPEFAGLLLDVCCFLKGLEIVERERGWPQRTAKVVLGLALDRLARHYGIRTEMRGPARGPLRYWRAPDARPAMGGG